MTGATKAVAAVPAPSPPQTQAPPGEPPGAPFGAVLEGEALRVSREAETEQARTAPAEGTNPEADDPGQVTGKAAPVVPAALEQSLESMPSEATTGKGTTCEIAAVEVKMSEVHPRGARRQRGVGVGRPDLACRGPGRQRADTARTAGGQRRRGAGD